MPRTTAKPRTSKPATFAARVAVIDAEIAMLEGMRAEATCNGELEMINDGIEAARDQRRAMFRTCR